MRSAVPKHFHPILGRRHRRLGDRQRGARRGAEPVVVVASPSGRDQFEEARVTVAVQAEPLGTGDAVRSRAGSARRLHGGCARALRRHAAAHLRAARAHCSTTHRRRAGRGNDPHLEAGGSALLRPHRARRRRGGRAYRRGHGCDARRARDRARSTRRSTSSAPTRSGRRSSGSSRRTSRASSISPTRSGCSSKPVSDGRGSRRPRSVRDRGREHPGRARARRRGPARPHQRAAHARRV